MSQPVSPSPPASWPTREPTSSSAAMRTWSKGQACSVTRSWPTGWAIVWYNPGSDDGSVTGLLTLTVDDGKVVAEQWLPARIQSDGLPRFADDADAQTLTTESPSGENAPTSPDSESIRPVAGEPLGQVSNRNDDVHDPHRHGLRACPAGNRRHRATDDVELHIHPGGQGVWQARLITALDVSVTLCACAGGEIGRVLERLIADEGGLRVVRGDTATGWYVHDRRNGERVEIAEHPGQPLTRHDIDELYGMALAEGSGPTSVC